MSWKLSLLKFWWECVPLPIDFQKTSRKYCGSSQHSKISRGTENSQGSFITWLSLFTKETGLDAAKQMQNWISVTFYSQVIQIKQSYFHSKLAAQIEDSPTAPGSYRPVAKAVRKRHSANQNLLKCISIKGMELRILKEEQKCRNAAAILKGSWELQLLLVLSFISPSQSPLATWQQPCRQKMSSGHGGSGWKHGSFLLPQWALQTCSLFSSGASFLIWPFLHWHVKKTVHMHTKQEQES